MCRFSHSLPSESRAGGEEGVGEAGERAAALGGGGSVPHAVAVVADKIRAHLRRTGQSEDAQELILKLGHLFSSSERQSLQMHGMLDFFKKHPTFFQVIGSSAKGNESVKILLSAFKAPSAAAAPAPASNVPHAVMVVSELIQAHLRRLRKSADSLVHIQDLGTLITARQRGELNITRLLEFFRSHRDFFRVIPGSYKGLEMVQLKLDALAPAPLLTPEELTALAAAVKRHLLAQNVPTAAVSIDTIAEWLETSRGAIAAALAAAEPDAFSTDEETSSVRLSSVKEGEVAASLATQRAEFAMLVDAALAGKSECAEVAHKLARRAVLRLRWSPASPLLVKTLAEALLPPTGAVTRLSAFFERFPHERLQITDADGAGASVVLEPPPSTQPAPKPLSLPRENRPEQDRVEALRTMLRRAPEQTMPYSAIETKIRFFRRDHKFLLDAHRDEFEVCYAGDKKTIKEIRLRSVPKEEQPPIAANPVTEQSEVNEEDDDDDDAYREELEALLLGG